MNFPKSNRLLSGMTLRRGFTLVEMLVTVAIMAIIASLLMVGINRGFQMAKIAKSVTNLRGLTTAVGLYVSDSQGRYPYLCDNTSSGDYAGTSYQGNYWSDMLRPYLPAMQSYISYSGQKFNQCPTLIDPFIKNGSHHSIADYGASTEIFRMPWSNPALRAAGVSRASEVVMIMTVKSSSGRPTWYLDTTGYVTNYANRSNDIDDRGTGEVLCVFLDGHIDKIPPVQFVENRRTLLMLNP